MGTGGLSAGLAQYQARVDALRRSSCMDFPSHVHMETMAKCNAACDFCPYPTIDRQGVRMEDALIEKIIDDLSDIPKLHTFQLSPFKVNEPFLDTRLFDILGLVSDRLPNVSITLTSNATPITEKKITELTKFPAIRDLWISFNDHRELEYEATMQLPYKRTIDRLHLIHQAKSEGRLGLKVVLSRVGDGSPADLDFCRWVGQQFPLFETSVLRRGSWIGQVKTNQARPEPVGCSRWFDVSITATGVVAHCCMDGNADFPIGDVRTEHVLDIYNNPSYRMLREKLVNRLEAAPCSDCGFL